MSQKSFSVLKEEIDIAVNPKGGEPLNTGPNLNAVLTSLATEVVGAGGLTQIVDYVVVVSNLIGQGYEADGPVPDYVFAVGDLATNDGNGLFRCIQSFALHYDAREGDVAIVNPPHSPSAYWEQVLAKTVDIRDPNLKVARLGEGGAAIIVAQPDATNHAPGYSSTILGGNANTVWANRGTTVGGQTLTLPEGADYSVIIGGQNYQAPAQPDTVFVPRLSVWKPGAGVQLTAEQGGPHTLAVQAPGTLTLDGQPAGGTPFVAYIATSAGPLEADFGTHIVPMKSLVLSKQPSDLPSYSLEEAKGGVVVPVSGLYEVTVQARLDAGALSPGGFFGLSGGPSFTEQLTTWTYGPSGPNAESFPVSAYNSQTLVIEAGATVFAYARFESVNSYPKLECQLTVRLLNVL